MLHIFKRFKSSEIEINEQVWPRNSSDVNVNVTDIILWQGHHDRIMQLN